MKCCIDGCDRPGTVHANHPGASVYCARHGRCAGCGISVAHFELSDGLWLCPCVIAGQRGDFSLRRKQAPVPLVTVGKKAKSVRDHWQASA